MEFLLRGDHPVLEALRQQFTVAVVESRKFTGCGFFTHFRVPPACASCGHERLVLGGVYADLVGLEHGAGFLCFVEHGYLSMLEGFTYDEPWIEGPELIAMSYVNLPRQIDGLGTIAVPGKPFICRVNLSDAVKEDREERF